MNLLDWLIVVYLAFGFWKGYRVGFVSLLLSLAGYAVAYVAAKTYYPALASVLEHRLPLRRFLGGFLPASLLHGGIAAPTFHALVSDLSFVVILLGVAILASMVSGTLTAARLRLPVLGGLNRLLGACLGVAEHLLIVGLVLFVLVPLVEPGSTSFSGLLAHSGLYSGILKNLAPSFARVR